MLRSRERTPEREIYKGKVARIEPGLQAAFVDSVRKNRFSADAGTDRGMFPEED